MQDYLRVVSRRSECIESAVLEMILIKMSLLGSSQSSAMISIRFIETYQAAIDTKTDPSRPNIENMPIYIPTFSLGLAVLASAHHLSQTAIMI